MTDRPEEARGFAAWLAAQRVRRSVFMAGLFPLPGFGLISAAIVVMSAELNGPRETLLDGLLALALLAGMAWFAGLDVPLLMQSAALSWLIWLGFGELLRRTRSLNLAVQVAVMLSLVGLLVFSLAVGDPVAFWTEVLETVYADLDSQGVRIEADTAAQAELMSGVVVAGTLLGMIIGLLLGHSWASRIQGLPFGAEFAVLKLGYVIGGLAALAGIAALLGFGLGGALLVFGAAFVFQGVAVLAWWAGRANWPAWWWLGLCVPLLLPNLLIIEGALLSAVGFVDNWYDLRRSRAD